ncbi:MAG TPA: ankyrin repeat domain-containing protein [Armatimonadota bacterium]|nr:ankyrin repeat domain-containing protein [Armatimonadota bacterium]
MEAPTSQPALACGQADILLPDAAAQTDPAALRGPGEPLTRTIRLPDGGLRVEWGHSIIQSPDRSPAGLQDRLGYSPLQGFPNCIQAVCAKRAAAVERPDGPGDAGQVVIWTVAGRRDPLQLCIELLSRPDDGARRALETSVGSWYATARTGIHDEGPLGHLGEGRWRGSEFTVDIGWGAAGQLALDALVVAVHEFDRWRGPLRTLTIGSSRWRPMSHSTRIARPRFERVVVERRGAVELQGEGDPPMVGVAMSGFADQAAYLLDSGFDVNITNPEGHAAAHWAAILPDTELLEMLIRRGAAPGVVARDGETPLLMACANGLAEAAEILIGHGADANAKDQEIGQTPLHRAAVLGEPGLCRMLLDAGADTGATDHIGWTPLHAAVAHARPDVVGLLLSCGSDANALDGNNVAPLHIAARKDTPEMARMLLASGADVEVCDSLIHKTPLEWAADRGSTNVAATLSEQGSPGKRPGPLSQ